MALASIARRIKHVQHPLTVAGAAQVRANKTTALLFPVSSPTFAKNKVGDTKSGRSLSIAVLNDCTGAILICQCYHRRHFVEGARRMLEELAALSSKLAELSAHVRALRDENQALRSQVTAAHSELDVLRARCVQATQRLDALLERLPKPLDAASDQASR